MVLMAVVTPADWVPGPPQGSWTYDAYAALADDGRHYEVVNGVLVMTPAPTPAHQGIVGMILYYLLTQVKFAGLGQVFTSPLDVDLGSKNVFQPDVVVVLNTHLERVQAKRIEGAPDLVVEVASYGTAAIDRISKYEAYARAGVAEYWIVKPENQAVEVFALEAGEYRSLGIFRGQATLPSRVVPGLSVRVEQFFV